jgi:hypothetical protein
VQQATVGSSQATLLPAPTDRRKGFPLRKERNGRASSVLWFTDTANPRGDKMCIVLAALVSSYISYILSSACWSAHPSLLVHLSIHPSLRGNDARPRSGLAHSTFHDLRAHSKIDRLTARLISDQQDRAGLITQIRSSKWARDIQRCLVDHPGVSGTGFSRLACSCRVVPSNSSAAPYTVKSQPSHHTCYNDCPTT